MGISSTTNRKAYQGDGTSATFAFPYYFAHQSDLQVYLYDLIAGVITPQVLNGGGGTGFTVSGVANSAGLYTQGGNVVFNSSPVATSQIIINREPSLVQNYTLGTNGLISSGALVNQLDYLTLLTQFLGDQVSRAVMLPDGMGSSFNTALPSTMPLAGVSANAPIIVNSSGTGFTFGFVAVGSGGIITSFVGTLPIGNGGTGIATPPNPGGIAYGNATGTQILSSPAGVSGLPLISGGAGAPSFQAISLNGPAVTGALGVGVGGTGTNTSYITNAIIYASSATQLGPSLASVTGAGTLTIPSGQLLNLPNGSLNGPSLTFASEGSTGIYRIGALEMGMVVGGAQVFDMLSIASSIVNIGMLGAPASNSALAPFIANRTQNAAIAYSWGNASTGANAATEFQITVGTASGKSLNFAAYSDTYSPTPYLAQAAQLQSDFNMLMMNIGTGYTGGIVTFTFGTPKVGTEAMRISSSSAILNAGVSFVMNGSSASGGSVIHKVSNSTATYVLTYPQAQASGTQYLQNDGSGNLSWAHNVSLVAPTKQVFSSAQTGTYTAPTGPSPALLKVTVVAGGGGGGGANTSAATSAAGGGGGGGGAGIFYIVNSNASFTASYTVGSGGPGGAAGPNVGQSGSSSVFSGVSASGGAGGGGGASLSTSSVTAGGAGGGAIGGPDVNCGGAGGGWGIILATSLNAASGAGGNSIFSGGGLAVALTSGGTAGNAASAPGGGGSGGVQVNNSGTKAGGAGGAGIIIVEEFYQ